VGFAWHEGLSKLSAVAIADDLLKLIIEKAALIPSFNHRLGPRGCENGNVPTRRFGSFISELVRIKWPDQVTINQPAICNAKFKFDFYMPTEATAIEIALSMRNSVSEYEKIIFMALLAKEGGLPLQRLILIGKRGSISTRNRPGSKAIRDWVKIRFNLEVEIHEFHGEATVRDPA
jgi:hypothetical protein